MMISWPRLTRYYPVLPSKDASKQNDNEFFEKYDHILSISTKRFLTKYYTKDVYYVKFLECTGNDIQTHFILNQIFEVCENTSVQLWV